MKLSTLKALFGAALFSTAGIAAYSGTAHAYGPTPDVYVVMFTADWCAPCRIVEPRLNQALLTLNDPGIEYVSIDISKGNGDLNAHAVFDRGLVSQYNTWLGVTGFAAIVDGDTKKTLGCVNLTYDTQSMTAHIANLKTFALSNAPTFDVTCPAPNNPA